MSGRLNGADIEAKEQKMTETAVYGTVRTVVWEDGGSNPASYSIWLIVVTPIVEFIIEENAWFLQ